MIKRTDKINHVENMLIPIGLFLKCSDLKTVIQTHTHNNHNHNRYTHTCNI